MLLHSCSCSTSINVIRKRNISIFIVQVIQFEWYHWQFDIISLSPDCSFEKWSVPNSTNFDAVHLHIISIFNSVVEVCMCGVERGRRGFCRRGPTSPISPLGPMHLHFCTVLCMRIWRVHDAKRGGDYVWLYVQDPIKASGDPRRHWSGAPPHTSKIPYLQWGTVSRI